MNSPGFYALTFLVLTLLPACGLFDGEPLIEPNDPCEEVHELYPNVGLDSCSWVLDVMRNYPPPEFLPPATDTGGPLMAARILTDTGEVLFVAQGVPDRFLGTPCKAWVSLYNQEFDNYLISGTYCSRPPIDPKRIHLSFYLSNTFRIIQEFDRSRLVFTFDDEKRQNTYELRQEVDMKLWNILLQQEMRILSGQFEAILHNRRDHTDSIRLVDGRFDMRY